MQFHELARLPADDFHDAMVDLLHEEERPIVLAALGERLASVRLRARDGGMAFERDRELPVTAGGVLAGVLL